MITLHDILTTQTELLTRVDTTRRAAEDAKAEAAAVKAAMTDLEDQCLQDALEAKNEAARKAELARLLRSCEPYQACKLQLSAAQARLRACEADFEDAQLRLKTADKQLVALGHQLEREAADVLSTAYQCYARGAVDIRRAAEAQLAARKEGASRA